MIKIDNKAKCCGCTACFSICSNEAISMMEDQEGFLYPVVNETKCIDCKACEMVCPVNQTKPQKEPLQACLIQNKSDEIRFQSTSGAAVNAIAEYVIKLGGCVYGAEISKTVECIHVKAESVDDLKKFQGSKYVQSYLGECYSEIKDAIISDRYVLFIGMPCQVAGLKSFLKKEYQKLFTIDLACHGVPSPGLFRDYVDYLSKKHGNLVTNVVFRDKTYGYSASNVKVYFTNGVTRDCKNDVKTFTRLMFNGISLRPSCYECAFKTKGRVSDFTIFDCALVKAYAREFDDDKGTTSVLVHNEKASALLRHSFVKERVRIHHAQSEELIKNEGTMLIASARKNAKRKQFFQDREHMSYEELTKLYAPVTIKMLVGNFVKQTLRYTGPIGKKLLKINKRRSISEYKRNY